MMTIGSEFLFSWNMCILYSFSHVCHIMILNIRKRIVTRLVLWEDLDICLDKVAGRQLILM